MRGETVSTNSMELMARRLRVLAEAAHEFSESTQEPERLLGMVARRLADVVDNQCVVRLISEDGLTLVPVAFGGEDADAEVSMREVYSEPVPLERHPLVRVVHETGEPFVAKTFDVENVRSSTSSKYF